MKQWLKFFFLIFPLSSFQDSLWTFLPGQNNGGPRSPASPQASLRGGRGLGTEGAAHHAEIWRRQIRWQRHREALSLGPKGKFAVIKRKMRAIKWLLCSFSQTFIFYYYGCLHLRDERSAKWLSASFSDTPVLKDNCSLPTIVPYKTVINAHCFKRFWSVLMMFQKVLKIFKNLF